MSRARVVVSATNIVPGNSGGAATFIWGLLGGLAQSPEVKVAVLADPDLVPSSLEGIEVLPVTRVGGAVRLMRDFAGLPRSYRSWRPDLLHYPHEWCPRADVPVVTTVQNIGWMHPTSIEQFGHRGHLLRGITRATSSRASSWTAVSPLAARLFAGLIGVPTDRVTVLPEGYGPPPRDGEEEIAHQGWLLVTGPAEYKRARLALEAYAQASAEAALPPLAVAGLDGRDHAPAAGVTFLGWLAHDELQRRMTSSTLCIFPSAVESFGLPAIESLAVGTPCLVASGTAMHQWLKGSVRVFDGSAADLAGAMLTLTDPDRAGLPEGLRFDWLAVSEAWARHYRSVLV